MAETTTPEPFNPTAHTVAQVNNYLATGDPDTTEGGTAVDVAERERVLETERQAEARKGILEGPHALEPGTPETTAGQSFQIAAQHVDVDPKGYYGVSPERERTGLADKGLSQQSPGILTGGPVPDPRQGVDDSAALKG